MAVTVLRKVWIQRVSCFVLLPLYGIQTVLELLLFSKASPAVWWALQFRQLLRSVKLVPWSRQALMGPCSWGHLMWCLFWLGRRHSICLSIFHWPVTALCRLLEKLFSRFLWNSSFSWILMEAFVFTEPSNVNFKLQLEITFRNRKRKDFSCWSRVSGYQLWNTRKNLRDVLAYISLLDCTSNLSSCWCSVSVERKL